MLQMLSNVLEHPADERYRSIRLGNTNFHRRVGRFHSSIELLKRFGFEEAQDRADTAPATHLALPVADPALLASGLVLMEAARQAMVLVDSDQGTQTEPKCSIADESKSGEEGCRKRQRSDADDVNEQTPGENESVAGEPTSVNLSSETTKIAEPAAELNDYSAPGIDAYFSTVLGGSDREILTDLDPLIFEQLTTAAREAISLTVNTGDDLAKARAEFWFGILNDFRPELAAANAVGYEPVANGDLGVVGVDGNMDTCVLCGLDGLLICCESCPQAYHAQCLGGNAPGEDADGDWFCPDCTAESAAIAGASNWQ